MSVVEHVDEKQRLYKAVSGGEDMVIVIGPPEGLVDELGLPEPFATRLHNILYRRGMFKYEDVCKRPQELVGALQEALLLDVQKITEIFFVYEKGVNHE